jgi:hypothetical protein
MKNTWWQGTPVHYIHPSFEELERKGLDVLDQYKDLRFEPLDALTSIPTIEYREVKMKVFTVREIGDKDPHRYIADQKCRLGLYEELLAFYRWESSKYNPNRQTCIIKAMGSIAIIKRAGRFPSLSYDRDEGWQLDLHSTHEVKMMAPVYPLDGYLAIEL